RGAAGASILFGRALGDTVGDLSDLQDGIDFRFDFLQFTGAIQRGDPLSQVVVRHFCRFAPTATDFNEVDWRLYKEALSSKHSANPISPQRTRRTQRRQTGQGTMASQAQELVRNVSVTRHCST